MMSRKSHVASNTAGPQNRNEQIPQVSEITCKYSPGMVYIVREGQMKRLLPTVEIFVKALNSFAHLGLRTRSFSPTRLRFWLAK